MRVCRAPRQPAAAPPSAAAARTASRPPTAATRTRAPAARGASHTAAAAAAARTAARRAAADTAARRAARARTAAAARRGWPRGSTRAAAARGSPWRAAVACRSCVAARAGAGGMWGSVASGVKSVSGNVAIYGAHGCLLLQLGQRDKTKRTSAMAMELENDWDDTRGLGDNSASLTHRTSYI